MRIEKDSLGAVEVPKDAKYGAQTQRAVDNFKISGQRLPEVLVRSLIMLKKCAALANEDLKLLPANITANIVKACKQIGKELDLSMFPVDIYQTGSGTSSNMNANEVIAFYGKKHKIHPNDHVNFGQSSNDVFPSAIAIATSISVKEQLKPALKYIENSLKKLANKYKKITKTGRTHLMDAMPITFEQEFTTWQLQIHDSLQEVDAVLLDLQELPIGGSAVGTGINTHAKFGSTVCKHLKQDSGIKFTTAKHKFKKMANVDQFLRLSSLLRALACKLTKICNDLRLMNSGPISGMSEIELPKVQPGSSIMPGKVNPVICESMLQICAKVIGIDTTISIAAQSGNFQLNVMYPLIANELLFAIKIMSNGMHMMVDKTLNGIKVNTKHIAKILSVNPILVTALNPLIGYEHAASIAKRSYETGRSILELAAEETEIPKAKLKKILDPYLLTKGGVN